MHALVAAVVGIGFFAIATPALAQAPVAVPEPGPVPAFVLMDVDGDHSKLELEGGLGFSTGDGSGTLWSGRARVQVMLDRAYGLYATLQGGGVTSNGESDFGFADPEIGGVVHVATGASSALGFHLGVVPGLSKSSLGGELASASLRPADLPLVVGGTSWLRGGMSTAYRDRVVFLRADVGVDQELDPENETFVHLNAGLGFGNQVLSAAAELQVLFTDGGDHTAEAATLSLHYTGATGAPYLAITIPFGELFKDLVTISVGASFAL